MTFLFFLSGPLSEEKESVVPPGRRLVVPLQICVLQGLSFVKARLLSMEIPAHVSDNLRDEDTETEGNTERLVKMNPFRGSWGLRFLELELSNPTDVVFEISVFVQLENPSSPVQDSPEYEYPKTRIDRDYSARVLIPLEHFKLPVLDGSFFTKDPQPGGSPSSSRHPSFSEKNTKAEINALIKNLISKIKVRWQSGRNSSGELDIKDAIQTALQTTVMDVLLPDPLTFGFRLVRNGLETDSETTKAESPLSKGSVLSHEVTPMEVLVRNNTSEAIKLNLSVTCRDVAGQNCAEGADATVLWAGNFFIYFFSLKIAYHRVVKAYTCFFFGRCSLWDFNGSCAAARSETLFLTLLPCSWRVHDGSSGCD